MRLISLTILLMIVMVTSPPQSPAGDHLTTADLVGRYTAEILRKGAPALTATIEIDTIQEALAFRCVNQAGDTLINHQFPRSRASYGAIGVRLSTTDSTASVNLWLDVLGTGQMQGRVEYMTHSPFTRTTISFRTISSLGAIASPLLPDHGNTYQQQQRTCSWQEAGDAAPCGAATSHPTGLCSTHIRESIREK